LSKLRQRLSDEVSSHLGEDFEIFQDRDDIRWGEDWKARIEESIDEVTFLIPIITPSFFKSPYCRGELERFLEREKQLGRNDLILPIYYIDTPFIRVEEKRKVDKLALAVHSHQYTDWRDLRYMPLSYPRLRRTLEKLAIQTCEALDRVQESDISGLRPKTLPSESSGEAREDQEDLRHRYRETVATPDLSPKRSSYPKPNSLPSKPEPRLQVEQFSQESLSRYDRRSKKPQDLPG
jgi:hypothetical protein